MSESPRPTIWLRAEAKAFERRTPLTPSDAATLANAGVDVFVERSDLRTYVDADYAAAGCSLVDTSSWKSAPPEAFVLGLKELPVSARPLSHRHIYFAHAFKGQPGWQELLLRFRRGGGALYDLEYLVDADGFRVAAFGRWAGFAGSAVALMAWCGRQSGKTSDLAPLTAYPDKDSLIESCRRQLGNRSTPPRVMIIGAAGRCGGGAAESLLELGVEVTSWDLEETREGGPFEAILGHDVLVNCVFVSKPIPPFLTREFLSRPRRLSVICDVSCDPSGDLNPLPVYNRCTTFADPLQRVAGGENPLDLIAIDHLPSLLPKESSDDFSNQLLPHLIRLNASDEGVWAGARLKYEQTLLEL